MIINLSKYSQENSEDLLGEPNKKHAEFNCDDFGLQNPAVDIAEPLFCSVKNVMTSNGTKLQRVSAIDIYNYIKTTERAPLDELANKWNKENTGKQPRSAKHYAMALINPAFTCGSVKGAFIANDACNAHGSVKKDGGSWIDEAGEVFSFESIKTTGFFALDLDFDTNPSEDQKAEMVRSLAQSPAVILAGKTFNHGVWALARGDNSPAAHAALQSIALQKYDIRFVEYENDEAYKNRKTTYIDNRFIDEPTQQRALPPSSFVMWGKGATKDYIPLCAITEKDMERAFSASMIKQIGMHFLPQICLNNDDLARSLGTSATLVLMAVLKPAWFGYGIDESSCRVCSNAHVVTVANSRLGKSTAMDTTEIAVKSTNVNIITGSVKTGEALEQLLHDNSVKKDGETYSINNERSSVLIGKDEGGSSRVSAKKSGSDEQYEKTTRMFMDGSQRTENSKGNMNERAKFKFPVEGALFESSTPEKFAEAVQTEDRNSGVGARRYEFGYEIPNEDALFLASTGNKSFIENDRKWISETVNTNIENSILYTNGKNGRRRPIWMTVEAYTVATMGPAFGFQESPLDYIDMIARISGWAALARECDKAFTGKLYIEKCDVLTALWIMRGIKKSRKATKDNYQFEARNDEVKFTKDLVRDLERDGVMTGETIYGRLKRNGLLAIMSLETLCQKHIIQPVIEDKTAPLMPTKRCDYVLWDNYEIPDNDTMTFFKKSSGSATRIAKQGLPFMDCDDTEKQKRIDAYFDKIPTVPEGARNTTATMIMGCLLKAGMWDGDDGISATRLVKWCMDSGLPIPEANGFSKLRKTFK